MMTNIHTKYIHVRKSERIGETGSGMTGELVMVNDRRLDLGTHCLGKSIKYV